MNDGTSLVWIEVVMVISVLSRNEHDVMSHTPEKHPSRWYRHTASMCARLNWQCDVVITLSVTQIVIGCT